jgi:hypothetical protein
MNETMWAIWESGQFVGDDKPVTRATIQKSGLKQDGAFRTILFDQHQPQYEIPNLKTIRIDRRLAQDAASLTLTFANQAPLVEGENLDEPYDPNLLLTGNAPTRRQLADLGRPGLYSYRRGVTPDSAEKWGHETDSTWVDMFIPNRVVRTFQGYGTDGSPNPWDDTKLILTGAFLIDRVEYTAEAQIKLHCRDFAKLLIEQRLYPPIIPLDQYPLEFCTDQIESSTVEVTTGSETVVEETLGDDVGVHVGSGWDSSVTPWYGYNGSVFGHRASHAFDGDESTYWLSVGNSGPNQVWSYEWIEADTRGEPVNRVRFKQKWGGYKIYIGVKVNGVWQGTDTVPYGATSEPAYPNDSDRPYVLTTTTPTGDQWVEIDLPQTYSAERVRITFTNLADSNLGTYEYRAAVYEMEVRHFTAASTDSTTTTSEEDVDVLVPGNIGDYTDIIKILAAWSGFHWPSASINDPNIEPFAGGIAGNVGRVWGDFFYSGAFPVEPPCIPPSFWDNKSVMDGINQIKEILGFIFFIDSTGGIIWRMPNIWRTGNFIAGVGYIGQDSVRDIDETQVLIDYGVTVDDTNLRSEIIVVSADDPTLHRAIAPGFAQGEVVPSAVDPAGDLALLGGQERIMLVPNYPFLNQDEVDKFAYLVSLWIHWSYRKSQFRIPGNPAFEPDDQVRIYERVTSESYVHYIQGISSSMNMDDGSWYLDIDTHWLGNGPDAEWVISSYQDMPPALYAYLRNIGQITDDGDPADLPPGFDPNFGIPDFPDEVPRLDTDLDLLFPDPPAIDYADIDDTWSDFDIAITYGGGWTGTPGDSNVYYRSEAWRLSRWGTPASTPRSTITFMREWKTLYGGFPIADQIAAHTHQFQAATKNTVVPTLTVPAYNLLAEILTDEEINVTYCTAFAGINRKISGTDRLSAHAWGLAIDINPSIYDCCSTPRSVIVGRSQGVAFLRAGERIVNEIRTGNGNRVFGWGGKWNSKKDWMHFEVIASPDDLRSGVSR